MAQAIAMIGLAVMGQNLVMNMADHGFTVAVYNRTISVVDDFVTGPVRGMSIVPTHSLEEMVAALKRPRRVMMLVKAGQPVDDLISKLIPLLEPGDIIIDGGNSNYEDSIRFRSGFTVEWEKKGGQYEIHEISCPYYQIGVAHLEVCTVDQTLISKMLAVPANKVQCILSGGAHCTYVVQPVALKN